uniref:DUF155 domain-containing protein n=1 Tax=Chlamydomonas leiostraca TaxID=1034604 RepID=A0A7S0RWY3_9CHLO|mmetsp:Transcript_33394/g.84629  ORF Transcript_33394/g.84629 Transcript_33394/m.84629 type:complete len:393 (+) Transcript_33394:216-1394(+)
MPVNTRRDGDSLQQPLLPSAERRHDPAAGDSEAARAERAERLRLLTVQSAKSVPDLRKKGPQAIPPPAIRQKDKFVPLPPALTEPAVDESAGISELGGADSGEGESEGGAEAGTSRRITVYCVSESLDRKALEAILAVEFPGRPVTSYSDVTHLALEGHSQDVWFFDFGVIIMFGLRAEREAGLMGRLGPRVERRPYAASEVEVDEFQFVYSAEPPHIKNDCFVLNKRQASNQQVRLAIAHALAQSVKLALYEERVWDLVAETRDLPEALAKHGKVPVSTKRVAQLIGKVFLQNANVNLLSSVLDTPAFFWSAPDHLQALYERACEYLELETRAEVLNARFAVLQEMLDMLRDHQNNAHAARLELIIIWLLVVDCVLMMFQLMSLFGVIGRK